MKYSFKSLFYNDHLDVSYSCDTLMEPMFWFVDNFTSALGPVRLLFKTQKQNQLIDPLIDLRHSGRRNSICFRFNRLCHRTIFLVG